MSTPKHSDIRALALAFYRGWIPREKYVSLRSGILNAISEGRKPKAINKKAIAPPKANTSGSHTGGSSGSPLANNKLLLISGFSILLILLVMFFVTSGEKPPAIDNTPKQSAPATSQPQLDTPATRFNTFLSTTFTQNSGWNQDNLNVLKFKWYGLSQEEQSEVRKGDAFNDFSTLLAESIAEERRKDSVVPSNKALMLITAARHIGLQKLLKK